MAPNERFRSWMDEREEDCATPKIITGKLAPACYVPSVASLAGTQDDISHKCFRR
jgi:hypothetical protein